MTIEDFKDGRGDDTRDVRRVKFKLADKRAALVDIAKHLGMFTDKLQVSGVIGIERWEQLSETEKQQRVASELLQLMGPERANGDDER